MWWLQVLSALLTPLIVAIAVYVARQQWRTAHTKFRQDYYERRLPIYRAAMTLVATAMTKGTVSSEDLRGFTTRRQRRDFSTTMKSPSFLKKCSNKRWICRFATK